MNLGESVSEWANSTIDAEVRATVHRVTEHRGINELVLRIAIKRIP